MSARELALAVDAAAAAVPGVVRVYHAPAGLGGAARLLLQRDDEPLSDVRGSRATVSIGVRADAPAQLTAGAVAAAVQLLVGPDVEVLVRVGRIEG
jgi:hypothetical protein